MRFYTVVNPDPYLWVVTDQYNCRTASSEGDAEAVRREVTSASTSVWSPGEQRTLFLNSSHDLPQAVSTGALRVMLVNGLAYMQEDFWPQSVSVIDDYWDDQREDQKSWCRSGIWPADNNLYEAVSIRDGHLFFRQGDGNQVCLTQGATTTTNNPVVRALYTVGKEERVIDDLSITRVPVIGEKITLFGGDIVLKVTEVFHRPQDAVDAEVWCSVEHFLEHTDTDPQKCACLQCVTWAEAKANGSL